MTQLERSLLYRADWTWQRTEEGILTLRYYWWCVQAAVLILVSLYRRYGLVVAINGASVSSRHTGRHGWETTDGEPISAVELIWGLRDEAKQRVALFDSSPVLDIQRPYVTPLNDRDGEYFVTLAMPQVLAIADAPEPSPTMNDEELDRLWEHFMEGSSA